MSSAARSNWSTGASIMNDVHSHLLRTEKRWKWNGCKRSTCYVAMLTSLGTYGVAKLEKNEK